jgi:S-DNA-T family DNA segregation ATPase FtsK/SpoIIIE
MTTMNRLKSAITVLRRPKAGAPMPSKDELDRLSRDIRGSLFLLATLFLLVALVSYLPLDTTRLLQGHIDEIDNLAGIAGAALSAGVLGLFGAPGYGTIGVLLGLAILSFRGSGLRGHGRSVAGWLATLVLASIVCYLLFAESTPEDSVLQGGRFGQLAGAFLHRYFRTLGASLLLAGGLGITLLVATGFSVSESFERLFPRPKPRHANRDPSDDADDAAPVVAGSQEPPAAATKATRSPAKRKRKAAANAADLAGDQEAVGGEDDAMADREEIATGDGGMPMLVPFDGNAPIPTPRVLKSLSSDSKKLSRAELKANAEKILALLRSFQIEGEITAIVQGPVLVTYEFKAAAGVKLSKIEALQDDLGVVMGTPQLRVVAPIPGKTTVGFEIPRPKAEVVSLKECVSDKRFHDKKLRLPVSLGMTTDGHPVFADLAAMPHLLVAGGTGSGKSVFVNSLITGLLFRKTPQELRMILVDPKMLELNVFDGLPHLVTNVITDNGVAFSALSWAVDEMERRYALMAAAGSKNIDSFNEKQKASERLPFLVIIVDELADIMMSGGKDVEIAITRLAQKARAAGIHLVLATQRPSTDVVTGIIKANMPSRIAFKVPSGVDSRTVLDASGAETLMGRGDSLMVQPGSPLRRYHGTFLPEEDIARVVKYVTQGRDYSRYYIHFRKPPPKED